MILAWSLAGLAWAGVPAAPTGRYLSAGDVVQALSERSELLAPCGRDVRDGAGPLLLAVQGSGRVTVEAAPPLAGGGSLAGCIEAALAPHPLPAHDEVAVPVSATLLVRQGRAELGPVIEVHEREVPSLFLLMPLGEPAATRAERLRLLGLHGGAGADPGSASAPRPAEGVPQRREPPTHLDGAPVVQDGDDVVE